MKNIFLIILFFNLSFISINAQESFPESWIGNYKGEVLIYSVDSIKMKVNMELKIARTKKDSIFDWTIMYDLKGKKDVRAYHLVVIDRKKGHYQIDEKNSIIIEAYLYHNNVFTSFFKVMESFIIASYTKEENRIIFEIISAKSKAVRTTGGENINNENIPKVNSYPINGRQKAILIKL